ncbi:hypothetical protein [uncultured Caulobacter sp.]|uniref:hypothetical protein n=1 Tax=uncultured Caulobacter sp. TaxID=158749 RepID=UPI00261214EE|nr:hypothetical protein [uncultured Caulobacter sp.]
MYQSEFPVEQPVPVFDPTLIFLLILAGLAIAGLAFFAGRLTGRTDKGEKASDTPKIIHDAIKAKCVAASSAHSGELVVKAQELIDEVRLRIGPVMAFGGPCLKAFEQLNKALKGEPPEEKKDDHAKTGKHGHDKDHGKAKDKGHGDHDKGHGGHDGHGDSKGQGPDIGLLTRNVTIVGPQTVVFANAPTSDKKPDDHHHDHDDHDAHKEEAPKVLDHKEFMQLLRLAVADFSDFWNRPNCLREIQDCHRVLTETKPLPKLKISVSERD